MSTRLDYDKARRRKGGAVMEAAKTFCRRCGLPFIPRRRYHHTCSDCYKR